MESKKEVLVKFNGKAGKGTFKIEIPESSNKIDIVRDALKEEHSFKHIENCKFFNQRGSEITDDTVILVKDHDVIYIEIDQSKSFEYSNIIEQFQIMEPLGEGGFGKVLKAKNKDNGTLVAIKYIDISDISI